MPTYLWQGKFHNSNSINHFIRNMTFMKIVQFFWYTVLQGTMMQFSHLFDAPLLTPLASILVGNYLFQGRFKSHFCYCLLQNMAIRVVEFSNGGYKIKKGFCLRINILKGNYSILRIGCLGASEVFKNQSFKSQLFSSSQ